MLVRKRSQIRHGTGSQVVSVVAFTAGIAAIAVRWCVPGLEAAGATGVACLGLTAFLCLRKRIKRTERTARESADRAEQAVQAAQVAMLKAFDEMQGQSWRMGFEAGARRRNDTEVPERLASVRQFVPRDRRGM